MFPITITLTVNSRDELMAVSSVMSQPSPDPAKPVKVEKPAPVKEEPKVEAPKPEPTPSSGGTSESEASAAPAASGASTGPSRTVDEAKALTMKLVAAKGREAAVNLLAKYGVPVAAKLPADKIAGFCAEAEGLLQ